MGDDARIEQCRRFEGIFVHEIGAHQPSLRLCEGRMGSKRLFHFIGARLEYLEQISMATLKVLENFGQLFVSRFRIERQDSIDDVIRPRLVCGVEIPRFGRRFEWAHDHSCRIRAQIQSLPIQRAGSDKMSFE